jgi:hypothetical protein
MAAGARRGTTAAAIAPCEQNEEPMKPGVPWSDGQGATGWNRVRREPGERDGNDVRPSNSFVCAYAQGYSEFAQQLRACYELEIKGMT